MLVLYSIFVHLKLYTIVKFSLSLLPYTSYFFPFQSLALLLHDTSALFSTSITTYHGLISAHCNTP